MAARWPALCRRCDQPFTSTRPHHAYKKSSPHAILNSFADDLKLLPISARTEQACFACVRQLGEFFSLSPDQLREYFIHLKTVKKVARQTSTQALCAIKLFWETTLRQPWPEKVKLVRANPQFKLPVILSSSEVRRVLACAALPDHRVCLSTIYSCGLRLGEGLKLEVHDVDAARMLLHIRAGKGNKDRYVPLSEGLKACLNFFGDGW